MDEDGIAVILNGSQLGLNSTTPYGVHEIWAMSILAACTVGLTGIVPLLFVPNIRVATDGTKEDAKCLKLFLSFAVGSLLGNVFLHLLPEAWIQLQRGTCNLDTCDKYRNIGVWVLIGLFTFMIVEIIFTSTQNKPKQGSEKVQVKYKALPPNSHPAVKNGFTASRRLINGRIKSEPDVVKQTTLCKQVPTIHISGYLNLLANSIDNFTHGLAVAASFTVGFKMGMLTTASILIHEIPHEVGDFAILLKSGFNRWDAAKAQISTATIGVVGAIAALLADSPEDIGVSTCWLLPFTAGGFLNIALVGILPDIMKEEDPWESMKQFICICGGISAMAAVNLVAE